MAFDVHLTHSSCLLLILKPSEHQKSTPPPQFFRSCSLFKTQFCWGERPPDGSLLIPPYNPPNSRFPCHHFLTIQKEKCIHHLICTVLALRILPSFHRTSSTPSLFIDRAIYLQTFNTTKFSIRPNSYNSTNKFSSPNNEATALRHTIALAIQLQTCSSCLTAISSPVTQSTATANSKH